MRRYEKEVSHKDTKSTEELEYLELRQRLKEAIREQTTKEIGSARKKLPYDNYGSFFGPSQPVITQRVIQESKLFLEAQLLASSVSNSYNSNEKSSASSTIGSKPGERDQPPKVVNELQKKIQKLRDIRDYSFLLSEDPELPPPTIELLPRNVSAPTSAQLPMKSKQQLGNDNPRYARGGREERRPVSVNRQTHSKSIDPRRQLSRSNGNGPGRPLGPKQLPPVATLEKQPSAPGAKNSTPGVHRQLSLKTQSSVPKKHLEHKPQINKPQKQISSHTTMQACHPQKKPVRRTSDDENERARNMIRNMYNTQRFAGRDDDDDSDMEANFDDIMREEKRSETIARKEDEEQLRLIEEEEQEERERLKRKKRKLSR